MGDRQGLCVHLHSSADLQERQECVQPPHIDDILASSSLSLGTDLQEGEWDIS